MPKKTKTCKVSNAQERVENERCMRVVVDASGNTTLFDGRGEPVRGCTRLDIAVTAEGVRMRAQFIGTALDIVAPADFENAPFFVVPNRPPAVYQQIEARSPSGAVLGYFYFKPV